MKPRRTATIVISLILASTFLLAPIYQAHAQFGGIIEGLAAGFSAFFGGSSSSGGPTGGGGNTNTGGSGGSDNAHLGIKCAVNTALGPLSLLLGFDGAPCIQVIINTVLVTIMQSFLVPLLGVAGWIFDVGIGIGIFLFKALASSDAITTGWKVGRDVANIFFIFMLIYIAIGTILKLERVNTKKMLVTLIIIALLINFSAAITRVVIDASNILALQFYEAMDGTNGLLGGLTQGDLKNGLSGYLVGQMGITYAFGPVGFLVVNSPKIFGTVTMVNLGRMVMLVVAIFALLAAGLMMFSRTVILLILIVLSPVAFIMEILPSQESHASNWWMHLFKQSFFAPAYLFMLYLTVNMANSDGLHSVANQLDQWGKHVNVPLSGLSMGQLFIYIVIIFFLYASLIVAQKMGAIGAGVALSGLRNVKAKTLGALASTARAGASFVGRRTIGRASSAIAKSATVRDLEARSPVMGGALRRAFEAGGKAKFGGKTSYEDVLAQRTGAADRFKESKQKQQYISNLEPQAQQALYEKMNMNDRIGLEDYLRQNGQENLIAQLRSVLTDRDQKKLGAINDLRNPAIDNPDDINKAASLLTPTELADALGRNMLNTNTPILNSLERLKAVMPSLSTQQLGRLVNDTELTNKQLHNIRTAVEQLPEDNNLRIYLNSGPGARLGMATRGSGDGDGGGRAGRTIGFAPGGGGGGPTPPPTPPAPPTTPAASTTTPPHFTAPPRTPPTPPPPSPSSGATVSMPMQNLKMPPPPTNSPEI